MIDRWEERGLPRFTPKRPRDPRPAPQQLRFLRSALVLGLAACQGRDEAAWAVDLDPPRLVEVDLVERAASPTGTMALRFSEPLDRASVDSSAVLVVPHEIGDSCTVDLGCESEARCHRGWCQRDPVDEAWLADAAHPPLAARRLAAAAPLALTLSEGDGAILIEPLEPLAPHRRHTLLVSPGLRDRAGNSLAGSPQQLLRRFATAGMEAARPSVGLLSPQSGATEVPTNLKRVVVQFTRPVRGVDQVTLWLEAGGRRVASWIERDSPLCPQQSGGAVGGRSCFVLRLAAELPVLSEVQLRGREGIYDLDGRPALISSQLRFASGERADREVPVVGAARLQLADGCAVLRLSADEPVDLFVGPGWDGATSRAALASTRHELSLGLPAAGAAVGGQFQVVDLAGNVARVRLPEGRVPAGVPRVVISEVLADPVGPEPGQELIELYNLGAAPVQLDGWSIDDGDDGVGQRRLPAASLPPASHAVVVGARYVEGHAADPSPPAGVLLLRLEGTLGEHGLANSGESLALRDEQGRLVSTYGGYRPARPDGRAPGPGTSVERIDVGGCDVAGNWRANRRETSSPGWREASDR